MVVVDKDDKGFERSELAVNDHELQASELKLLLDESRWLDFDCVLEQLDGEHSLETIIGSTFKLESEVVKEKWLSEWIGLYCEEKRLNE